MEQTSFFSILTPDAPAVRGASARRAACLAWIRVVSKMGIFVSDWWISRPISVQQRTPAWRRSEEEMAKGGQVWYTALPRKGDGAMKRFFNRLCPLWHGLGDGETACVRHFSTRRPTACFRCPRWQRRRGRWRRRVSYSYKMTARRCLSGHRILWRCLQVRRGLFHCGLWQRRRCGRPLSMQFAGRACGSRACKSAPPVEEAYRQWCADHQPGRGFLGTLAHALP